MPPRPLPPWSTVTDRGVVVAVLTSTAITTGRQAARAARALCAAGADGVEIISEAGLDPAAARCSPAELVAAIAEEHLPVGLTVRSAVAAHLGVGAGAAWLRVQADDLEPLLAETLAQMGRPCIVAGLLRAGSGGETLTARVSAALAAQEVAAFDPDQLLVEVLAAELAGGAVESAATSDPRPVPAAGADTADRNVDLVVDLAGDPGEAIDDEVRRGALAADVTLAIRAGVRILRTADPVAARRAAHVAQAIGEAR